MTSASPARSSRGGSVASVSRSDDDGARLIKRADQVLAAGVIDAGLAAHRGIDLRQQRRGHLHEIDAALVAGRRKPGHVADHTAAQRHDAGVAIQAAADERIEDPAQHLQRLVLLAVRQHDGVHALAGEALGQGVSRYSGPTVALVTTNTSRAVNIADMSAGSVMRLPPMTIG